VVGAEGAARVHGYKAAGGGYKGERSADNHLTQWTREEWGTKSGEKSEDTGERYLPKQAQAALSDAEYQRTWDKKRTDARRGRQHSKHPADVADKVADVRLETMSVAALRKRAASAGIEGRSKMDKAGLVGALSHRPTS